MSSDGESSGSDESPEPAPLYSLESAPFRPGVSPVPDIFVGFLVGFLEGFLLEFLLGFLLGREEWGFYADKKL
jgi:hypothetical protein